MEPNKPAMKLKDNLKIIMEQRGISATQLSRLAKIRKQRISDWLAGATPKDLDQLKAVASALQLPIDALLFGSIVGPDKDSMDRYIESFPEDAELVFQVTVKRLKEKR